MQRRSSNAHIDYALLQQHFHLPISEVAKELGVCATVLKKLCRQNGITRWPHRKIKSLNKMIATLEDATTETEEEETQRIIELNALQRQKAEILKNPGIIGPTYSHLKSKAEGKQSPNSAQYRPRSIDITQQEKSARAALPMQRKTSLEPQRIRSPYSTTNTTIPSLTSSFLISNHVNSFSQNPNSGNVRFSSPAVLQGLSSEQLRSISMTSDTSEQNSQREETEQNISPPQDSNSSRSVHRSMSHSFVQLNSEMPPLSSPFSFKNISYSQDPPLPTANYYGEHEYPPNSVGPALQNHQISPSYYQPQYLLQSLAGSRIALQDTEPNNHQRFENYSPAYHDTQNNESVSPNFVEKQQAVIYDYNSERSLPTDTQSYLSRTQ